MKHAKFFGFHGDELRFLPGEGGGWTVFRPRQSPKSRTPVFFSGTSLSLALSIILEDIGEQMWVNAALFVLCKTPDSLHQVRVSLRRLESFCLLLKMLPVPPALLQESMNLDMEAQRLRSLLAPERDWEVFFQSLFSKMKKRFSAPEEQQVLSLVVKNRKKKASRKARTALDSMRFVEMLLETESLKRKVLIIKAQETLEEFRRQALVSIEKEVMRRSLAGSSRKKLHRLRIALKTFRYVSGFFPGEKAEKSGWLEQGAVLSALDRLGDLNDLYCFRRRLIKIRQGEESGKRRLVMDRFIRWVRRKEKKSLSRTAGSVLFQCPEKDSR